MRNYLIFTMLALALLASCSRSSIQKGALTRVIVERRSLPTDDTILARLGGVDGTGAQQGSDEGSGQGSDEGSGQETSTTGSETDPTTATGSTSAATAGSDEGSTSGGVEKPADPTKTTGSEKPADPTKTTGSEKPATPVTPATPSQELLYHVIVASFPLERADVVESEVAKLRAEGVDAHIVKSDGRARLAYASFATKAEATAARDSLVRTTPKYRDAWVLRAKL